MIAGGAFTAFAGGLGWLLTGRLRDTTQGAIATGHLANEVTEQLRAVNADLRAELVRLTAHVLACDALTHELKARVAALEAPRLDL